MSTLISNVLICILLSNLALCYAQSCKNYTFSRNETYRSCRSLPLLHSHLHWGRVHSNGSVNIAFRHTGSTTSQWVAWALNFRGWGMIGAQALVALTNANGSIEAYTSSVTSYETRLRRSPLSFDVPAIRAERVNGDVVIHATIMLPSGSSLMNQVWQVGLVTNGVPRIHSMDFDNRNSVGMVDFLGGYSITNVSSVRTLLRRKNTHGVLSAVSWGVLMPMGAMVARYLKVFKVGNPAWFYIHAATQTTAYGVGVAGWAVGLKLGGDSVGIRYDTHRNIGITLFVFATLQVCALFLRPKPESKYRFYWNIYHRSLGYSVIILSIINVYKGLDILDPEKNWQNAYTGIIIALGVITVLFEALTCFIVSKRSMDDKKRHAGEAPLVGVEDPGEAPRAGVDDP